MDYSCDSLCSAEEKGKDANFQTKPGVIVIQSFRLYYLHEMQAGITGPELHRAGAHSILKFLD